MKVNDYSTGCSLGSFSLIPKPSYKQGSMLSTNSSLIEGRLVYSEGDNTSKYQIEYLSPDFWFNDTPNVKLKEYYAIQEAEFSDIIRFVSKYQLANFLLWCHQPIVDIFGDINKKLQLKSCWDEEDGHLALVLCSNLENLDDMILLEEKLFAYFECHNKYDDALHYIVISQD